MKTFKLGDLELNEKQMREVAEAYNRPEFEYPLFRQTMFGVVIKFTAEAEFEVVMTPPNSACEIGTTSSEIAPGITHTEGSYYDVPYDSEAGLWHGQPVFGFHDYTCIKVMGFYDAVNRCMFDGTTKGPKFLTYEAIEKEQYTGWHLQTYVTLGL